MPPHALLSCVPTAPPWWHPEPIRFRGETFRTRTPDETWPLIEGFGRAVGVTRVADVTGLDDLGLPTHVAIRPVGKTLAVSIGSGLTPAQSRVSAVMESVETWHGENPPPVDARSMSATDLRLDYDVRELALAFRSPVSSETRLDWVSARGIFTGRQSFIPMGTLLLDARADPENRVRWDQLLFSASSNGMATGNTVAEAVVHGLYEIVERDCWAESLRIPAEERRRIDPGSVDNPVAVATLAALRAADSEVWVHDVTNDIGIPTYTASVWSEAVPMVFGGAGCHLDPGVAVGRALAEAAQSRLVGVSGARDDIGDSDYRRPLQGNISRPVMPGGMDPVRSAAYAVTDLSSMIRTVAAAVALHTGVEPLVVDLTCAQVGVPAVKVYAPGLHMYTPADVRTRSLAATKGADHD